MGLSAYLWAVNAAAFALCAWDAASWGPKGKISRGWAHLAIVAGGSLGAAIAWAVWGPRAPHRMKNALAYAFAWMSLQATILWMAAGPASPQIRSWLADFYARHKALCLYAGTVNLAAFGAFAVDKLRALRGQWRIREAVLLGLSLAGGALGGMLAMDLCRHKVNKKRFRVGLPLMLLPHLALLLIWLGRAGG